MIGTIQIKCSAHNPSMPLCPVFAFQDSYQQVRISDVPKKIGDWNIKKVEVECQFPNNQVMKFDCSLVGGVWITTINSCSTAGTTKNGFVVNGYDENDNKYILGKSDLYILTNDSRVIPQKELDVVNILQSKPETPHIGDAVFVDGKLEVYDGENWISTGSGVIESYDIPGYAENAVFANSALNADYAQSADQAQSAENAIHAMIADSADEAYSVEWDNVQNKPSIPTKTSELENDSGYITQSEVDTNKIFAADRKQYINGEGEVWKKESGYTPWVVRYVGYDPYPQATLYWSENEETGLGIWLLLIDGNQQRTNPYPISWDKTATHLEFKHNDDGDWYDMVADREAVEGQWTKFDDIAVRADIPVVNDSTITIKQGGETKGTFTLNQATPKTIELDAGGGSDGGCILETSQTDGYVDQNVTWTNKEGKQCKVCPNPQDTTNVVLYIDGVARVSNCSISVPVNGNISINWDGYASSCPLILDGCYTSSRPTVIDSSLYKHILISFHECLEENTLITMADGSTKAVKDIEVGDIVMSMNPYTGKVEPDEATFGYCGEKLKSGDTADEWTFDDGTILKTVHPHQFYNVRTGKMEYIADFQIGDKVRKQDGTETALVKHELILKRTKHATLFTRKFNNYFANGILTGNRKSVKWGWYWIEEN